MSIPESESREVVPLLEHLDAIAGELERRRPWSLLLDFDGTLAPIVARPDLARIPEATRASLRRLAARPEGLVAIVTGRAIAEARSLVGLDSLIYAGNHGLEIAGPAGLRFLEPRAEALASRLQERGDMIASAIGAIPGVQLQHKGLTCSVHYRQVAPESWDAVAAAVREAVPEDDPDFALHDGKRVHEIRPRVAWGKGRAAAWILSRLDRRGDLCFFLGDDVTDEDAFRELAEDGVTVRVGPFTQTAARYSIPGPDEVGAFLAWLADRVGCGTGSDASWQHGAKPG